MLAKGANVANKVSLLALKIALGKNSPNIKTTNVEQTVSTTSFTYAL